MPSITLPDGYAIYGYSNNGDTVTAYKSDSTSAAPHFLVIDRKRGEFSTSSKTWSIPSYRIRVIRGNVDGEGMPVPERTLAEITFRAPVGRDAEVAPLLVDVLAIMNDPGLEDSIHGLLFPTCCDDEPVEP